MDHIEKALNVQYVFVLVKNDTEIELKIDQEDFILNADDELDIPLEMILRKNHLTLTDLYTMNVQKLLFVRKDDGHPITLKQICLDINL
ncbi:hypothetical protein QNK01_05590 [Desemzia incerta]|uniref:hypothetical protein n=1 Tax=Desemzia incerta TaxID=82801 RepID=UPI0016615141|nr:hypothetical protein [Desemzia incerta]WHZ33049.1 hypothetical protein QNK01_05590 [Desemzia incerta]